MVPSRLGGSTTPEDASHPTAARNSRSPFTGTPLASSATLTSPNEPQERKNSDPKNYHDIETLKEANAAVKFDAPDAPPDGGLKAWSTVLGASLVAFSTFGFANAFGAFADFYSASYLSDFSPTLISMIGALQIFVLYLLAGVSGAMFDAIGPRYLIPFSGVVVVVSLFLLSVTQPQQIYQQFLCQSVLFSIGAAFGFFPALALMSHWFKFKMRYAVGCIISGSSIGGIIYPIMLTRLVPRIGFGWTMRVIAFMSLFCYAVGTLTIYPRRPTKPLPRFTKLLDFNGFKDPCYLFLALGCWFGVFSIWNPFFYVGLSAELANPGSPLNQYYLSILCASSVVGRVSPGLLASRVGRFNLLWMSTFLSAVLIFALWYTSFSEASLVTFVVLYGIVAGPFFTLIPPCVASLSPIDRVGARLGSLYAFMATACLAGTPVGGVFITTSTVTNYKHLILFSGLMAFVGAAFLFAARMVHDRRVFVID
ncbi:major facilitator superfamily domain-containing protein [Rhodocollybia butyracea]|uniref:Major facilitator superfamily domain-containing protein n=1 Tax=Rhodocollybia butyracea TaxID=206335 RepID=A0A9P5P7L9_9AGAR|nr:major facilitator superfamily domain-containing protein [Rhodocollybia butyracea]